MDRYSVITRPTSEPIAIDDARAHLRLPTNDDDPIVKRAIQASRWNIERVYRRYVMQQTVKLTLDYFGQPEMNWDGGGWPSSWSPLGWWSPTGWWPPSGWGQPLSRAIELRPPVQSIVSVQYYDTSGVLQTLSQTQYYLDNSSDVASARLTPALNTIWPVTSPQAGSVQITYLAGYPNADSIPVDQISAMYLLLGDLYENREQTAVGARLVVVEMPRGVDDLMAPYKFWLVR